MVEMLPLVKIAPELNLTLDPSTGIVGASLGREVLILSMDAINEQITELEAAANDLYTALRSIHNFCGFIPWKGRSIPHSR